MVALPDHLHAVWRLPEGDADFPLRWRKLKSRFTRAVGGAAGRAGDSPTLREWRRSESKIRKGERGLLTRISHRELRQGRNERDYAVVRRRG